MDDTVSRIGQAPAAAGTDCALYQAEYESLHAQRLNLIRNYNLWYVFGLIVSMSSYWVLMHLSLSVSSLPLMIAGGLIATVTVMFAYRVVVTFDAEVVALYPRIIFLELMMGYDFYRDFLRERFPAEFDPYSGLPKSVFLSFLKWVQWDPKEVRLRFTYRMLLRLAHWTHPRS